MYPQFVTSLICALVVNSCQYVVRRFNASWRVMWWLFALVWHAQICGIQFQYVLCGHQFQYNFNTSWTQMQWNAILSLVNPTCWVMFEFPTLLTACNSNTVNPIVLAYLCICFVDVYRCYFLVTFPHFQCGKECNTFYPQKIHNFPRTEG